ncbi:SIR2 family protein [Arenibacter sp. M-2]|uniref:SIR2 family NAD-dependent protein deacylase n=1 Tax=Arenibacter sp. M-2 TaxID=3053612 RepID=UPI0025709764|nr:SIR2 family protein [Arenibacter sp. M-2]MDL5514592.1 SIR2 family protein [Arenibacter sp. M-2]
MGKERIFELIRKEEVVLFVGAGMSMYAGYPSGAVLSKIFYNNLSKDQKSDIEFTADLPRLANDIYYLNGGNKNYLFQILKREFQRDPISTETHKLLAKIPHFKTIITTNYDTLIESFNKNVEVIRRSKDYPLANSKKQLLFKIHGDLSDPERIILTNSDYNNYFSSAQEDTVFWNAVKDKLASNHVLFIGYSMEDSNIQVMLDKIVKQLGENRKEMFFIAPRVSAPKQKYLQRNNITVLRGTGEEFIKECFEDLKLNYFPNLDKGHGTADTALNFANSNLFHLEISKKNKSVIINNVKSLDGDNSYKINFKIHLPNEKRDNVLNSLHGKDFNDILLEGDALGEFNYIVKDFRIKNYDDIKNLLIKKLPSYSGLVDIVFDDGFEVDNYKIELYRADPSDFEHHLKIVVKGFEIIIKFKTSGDYTQLDINIAPEKNIKSCNQGILFYEILTRIVAEKKFKAFENNKLIYTYLFDKKFEEDALSAKQLKEYFLKLKKIEKHFDVRFSKIDLREPKENFVETIIAYIDKIQLKRQFNEFKFKIVNKDKLDYLTKNNGEGKLLVMSGKYPPIDLHGLQFDIGYLHKMLKDGYIANIEELKANKTTEIKVKSRTNTVYHQFTDGESIISQG